MPEIAEVFTLASGLASLLGVPLRTGVRAPGVSHPLLKWNRPFLTRIEVLNPRSFRSGWRDSLINKRPETVLHSGKVLRIAFEGGDHVLDFHFGMTGRLGLVGSKHDRVRLHFGENVVHYIDPRKFGWLEIKHWSVAMTGSCATGYHPTDYEPIFQTRRAVRDVLTDQRIIAGLGNYMVNEVLWRAQVHPFRPANSLEDVERYAISAAVEETIFDSARAGGATLVDYFGLNGDPGMYAKSFNAYGKKECPRCRGPLVLLRKRPSDQSSYVCPACQNER